MRRGGTPVVPLQRWVEDHPNCHPTRQAKVKFGRYSLFVCAFAGYCFANKMTDDSKIQNHLYDRPDLKPKAAMVKDTSMYYDDEVYNQMIQANYKKDGNNEYKKSSLYRLFRPLTADYNTKSNDYVERGASGTNFNPVNGRFPLHTNNYADHEN